MTLRGSGDFFWREAVIPLLDTESGLYAPAFFYRRLREEIDRSRLSDRPFSVLSWEAAPANGSRLRCATVRSVARTLVCLARPEDVPARLHRHTFALLLPDIDAVTSERIGRIVELDLTCAASSSGAHWATTVLTYPAQASAIQQLAGCQSTRALSRRRTEALVTA